MSATISKSPTNSVVDETTESDPKLGQVIKIQMKQWRQTLLVTLYLLISPKFTNRKFTLMLIPIVQVNPEPVYYREVDVSDFPS